MYQYMYLCPYCVDYHAIADSHSTWYLQSESSLVFSRPKQVFIYKYKLDVIRQQDNMHWYNVLD